MGENCDADGYLCEFEDDIPEVERKFYLKVYPKIDLVVERRVHCTSCGNHIGTAPISEAIVRMHPVLKVTQCRKCHTFYNSGEFERGEDGSELYCRWCGQGGEVYCCAKCPYVFCKGCIVQNLSRGCVNDIAKNETWNCFSCAPKIMWHLRAQHWALVNFMEKQKKKLLDQNLTEDELNEQMSKDLSSCCKNKPKKTSPPMPAQKRPSSILKLPQLQAKKPNLLEKSVKMASNMAKKTVRPSSTGGENNEVVCTPDIMSMFDEPQATVIPKPTALPRPVMTPRIATPAVRNPPPLLMRQFQNNPSLAATQRSIQQQIAQQQAQQSIQLTLPAGFGTGPNATPVYHTINGYRIDLNTAAQQETFRLPNGKLIQVKKQLPVGQMAGNASAPPARATYPAMTSIRPRANMPTNPVRPQTVPGNNSTYVSVRYNQANPTPPPSARLLNGGSMYSNQPNAFQAHFQNQQLLQQQQQQLQQQHQQQLNQHQPQQPQHQQQTSNATHAAPTPQIVFQRVQHPPTKLGKTRTHFEDKVFGGLEVCHQIIAKINTLTNSSSYKNVRNFRDLKELNIHLSYLFQYAMGRFKGLQEKVVEDIKSVAAVIAETEANDKQGDSDGDDLEIMEPETTLIELDSDDDTARVTTSGGPKKQKDAVPPLAVIRASPALSTLPLVSMPPAATIRLITRPDTPVAAEVLPLPSLDDAKLKQPIKVKLQRAEAIYPHLKAKLEAFKARRMAEKQLGDIASPRSTVDISDDEDMPLSVKAKQAVVRRKRKASLESSDSDWEKDVQRKKKRVKFADDRSNQSGHSRANSNQGSTKGSIENLLDALTSSTPSRPFRKIGEENPIDGDKDDEVNILDGDKENAVDDLIQILEAGLEKVADKTDDATEKGAAENKKDDVVNIIDVDTDKEDESKKDDSVVSVEANLEEESEKKRVDEVEILEKVHDISDEPKTDEKKDEADAEMVELIDVSDKEAAAPPSGGVDKKVEETTSEVIPEKIDKSKNAGGCAVTEEPAATKKADVNAAQEKEDEPEPISIDDVESEKTESCVEETENASPIKTASNDSNKDPLNGSEKDPLNETNVLDSSDDLLDISVTQIMQLDSSPEKSVKKSVVDPPKSSKEDAPKAKEAQPEKEKSPEPSPAQEAPAERPLAPQVVNPLDVSHELSPPPSPMSPPPSPPNEVPILNGVVGLPPVEAPVEEKATENGNKNGEKSVANEQKAESSMKDSNVEGKSTEPAATTSQDQQLGLEDLIEHGLTSEDYGVAPEDWNTLMM